MATVYQEYAASSNLTVTNLHSLAASSGLLAGWTSGTIDNTSDKHGDKVVSGKFTMTSSNNQAGRIEVWGYAQLDDSNWPDIFSAGTEGTEGTATIHDDEQKASALRFLWSTAVDTGTGEVHTMPPTSLRQAFGFMPAKCALFVTGNGATSTNAQFAASGNQITVKGLYETVS